MRDREVNLRANLGQNTFSMRHVVRGDSITARGGAFKNLPDRKYAKDGGMNEWEFDIGIVDVRRGKRHADEGLNPA
jgi:Protein of unknown function (DUF3277)